MAMRNVRFAPSSLDGVESERFISGMSMQTCVSAEMTAHQGQRA